MSGPATVARPGAAARAARQERAFKGLATGAAVLLVLVILAVVFFVMQKAWPAVRHNGPSFLGTSDVTLDDQLQRAFSGYRGHAYRELHIWPGLLATLLTTGGALLVSLPFSIFSAVFIAVLAPRPVVVVLEPVVRLLSGVPSVIFGLFGLLLIAPFLDRHLLDPATKEAYSPVVPLSGSSLLTGIIVLTVMIAPIMIAIFVDALRRMPLAWTEGSLALGTDAWRTTIRIALPWIRPAIVAGTILAAGRAVGEAIALSMVTGSLSFIPNPLDGATFLIEPVHPLAALIVDFSEGLGDPTITADLFAFGAVLLLLSLAFSVGARAVAAIPGRRQSRAL